MRQPVRSSTRTSWKTAPSEGVGEHVVHAAKYLFSPQFDSSLLPPQDSVRGSSVINAEDSRSEKSVPVSLQSADLTTLVRSFPAVQWPLKHSRIFALVFRPSTSSTLREKDLGNPHRSFELTASVCPAGTADGPPVALGTARRVFRLCVDGHFLTCIDVWERSSEGQPVVGTANDTVQPRLLMARLWSIRRSSEKLASYSREAGEESFSELFWSTNAPSEFQFLLFILFGP